MRVIYTRHVRFRMGERNISEAEVEQVLTDPDITWYRP